MVRNVVGFAGFAVVALLALKLVGGLFGIVFGLIGTVLWFAFWGFIFYLILRVIWPSAADRVRETVRGEKPVA
jgi:O-antigen/teichoic acid export membrane protein